MPKKQKLQYSLRTSKRAKRVIFRISFQHGFEVIIPQGFDPEDIPILIAKRKKWIQTAIKDLEKRGYHQDKEPHIPTSLNLKAINQKYTMDIIKNNLTKTRLTQAGGQKLLLTRGHDHKTTEKELIENWIKKQAKIHLTPWLRNLSQQYKLDYKKLQIRIQHSRWGSYSAKKTISLNALLLFLPRQTVNYVLLHELAHSKYPNHSQAYWQFLQQLDKNAMAWDKDLHNAWEHIPAYFVRQ